jgi:peroxiredoxin Q/BCP
MADKTVAMDRKVPAFSLPATGGRTWKLAAAAGKPLVVYFYPKDATSGCTQEGEAFRDLYPKFRKAGVEIVGISPDSVASHEKFKSKHGFPFELLSDEERVACQLFGVWKEKSMYGRKYMGVARVTYLIDAEGTVAQRWDSVKVETHPAEVLAAVDALGAR